MATTTVTDEKEKKKKQKKDFVFFDNQKPGVWVVRSDKMWGEVPGDKLVIHWKNEVHEEVNYLDEDLFLNIKDAKTGELVKQERINHLVEKETDIETGREYEIQMIIKERFHMGIATTAEYTPPVALIPEGINRYMLTWGELEWSYIKDEVERQHNVNWERDVDVVLKINRYEGDEISPKEEWRFPGFRNMEIVGGMIKEITLSVLTKTDKKNLKEIFRVYTLPGKEKKVLDTLTFNSPQIEPYFYLDREVHETDANHIRASWEIPDEKWEIVTKEFKKKKKELSNYEINLKLYSKSGDDWVEFRGDEIRQVFSKGTWFIVNIPGGTIYKAKLIMTDKNDPEGFTPTLIESNEFYFPRKNNEVTLIPMDSIRAFAYWHLNKDEIYAIMKEKHNAEPGSIRTILQIYHDFAGGLHHHGHLDIDFNMHTTDNYYLELEPDKVYRARILAIAEGWKTEFITPYSNPIQTMREIRGNSPVSYISFPQPQDHPTNRRLQSRLGTADHSQGKIIFHMHAHLPFVWDRINYGTSGYWRPGGYVEEWFHEAMRETYLPLIRVFDQLIREGVDFKVSMDISPTLCNMMRNPILQEEFINYIDSLIALAKTEFQRTTREEPWYSENAKMHLREFRSCKSTFLKYNRDLTQAFKKFQDMGKMEILTCGATHGYLPLMGSKHIEAIRGQIKTAVLDYEQTFGRKPYGIWLPECAYTTGIEKVLQDFGLRYFFSETHTVLLGDSYNEFGVNAPSYIKGSQVAVFARDPETGKQVWSGDEGYPGDPDYLEFHIRGGPLKYNRITDRRGGFKQPYVQERAEFKASIHAQNFLENRNFRFNHIKHWFWKKPVVVATYDAELFGHHWYEGPRFIYYLFKKLHYDQNQTELTTPMHYLAEHSYNQEIWPTPSSWGHKGTFEKWMYGSISWMYRHMNDACQEMVNLASWAVEKQLYNEPWDNPGRRMLNQMARELLLAQNSDAGFNISNGHFIDRMKDMYFRNLNNFWMLANMFVGWMQTGNFDDVRLRKVERAEQIFPIIDPFVWAK